MKIELKSIKHMDGHEGIAFSAKLYIDGKRVGNVRDDGNGGEVYIWIDPAFKKLEKEAREWALGLPPIKWVTKEKTYSFDSDLEMVVNNLFDEYLKKKEASAMLRLSKKYIIWGNDNYYKKVSWKGKTLEEMSRLPKGVNVLQSNVDRIKATLKDNEKIFFPEYLETLGVKI